MVFFTDSSYEKLSDRRGSEPLVSSSSIDLRGDAMDTSSTPSKIAVSVIHITPWYLATVILMQIITAF